MSEKVISIWTDGSSHNNGEFQGIGGFGSVLIYSKLPAEKEELYSQYADDKYVLDIYEGFDPTTNQQMEIKAVTEALKRVKDTSLPVYIFSDSAYVINCMTKKWWQGWIKNGWKNSKKEPVANKEYWVELINTINDNMFVDINWCKVKGHSKIFYNERADDLAGKGTEEMKNKRLTNT
jgi:ribonuclease HI